MIIKVMSGLSPRTHRGCREPKPSAGRGSGLDPWVTFCFILKCALFLKLVASNVKEAAGLLGDSSQAFKNRGFVQGKCPPELWTPSKTLLPTELKGWRLQEQKAWISVAMWLTGSWCSSSVSGLSLWSGRAKFRTLVHQRPPGST